MASENRNFGFHTPSGMQRIDYYGIMRDVAANRVVIILLALAMGLFAFSYKSLTYHPQYETEAVFVVSNTGTSNNVYLNLQSAQETAANFQGILNSNILRKTVAEELDMKSFQGTANARSIEGTNLMVLTVRAGDPRTSYAEMMGILENYKDVSAKIIGRVVLTTLRAPTVPSEPANPMNAVKPAIIVALLTAAALILLLGFLSLKATTIRTEYDIVDKLDVNRLATITHEKYSADLDSLLVTDPTVSFHYVETMQKLARRVMSRMDAKGAKSILITSVMANEGKSTVAANLALSMALSNKKVVLIDCDFRNPSQYKVLRLGDTEFTDLGSYLIEGKDVTKLPVFLAQTGLITILNKKPYANSTELLSSPAFRAVLDACVRNADYVVIDTSPMAFVADAEEMISEIDMSALVIRQDVSEARDINDAVDVLRYSTDSMIGCIFNDVLLPSRGASGSYGYGSGSYGYGGSYGSYGSEE